MEYEVRARAPSPRTPPPLLMTFANRAPQELEFIIHTDGRVEERTRGFKGNACVEATLEINQALGEVYESKPTQEAFEQPVEVSEGESVSDSWSNSGSSSGGSSESEW